MERQSIFRKFTIIIAFIMLSLGLLITGLVLPVKSYADTEPADPSATTYTVAFKVAGQLYTAYKLNSGQTVTQPTDGDLSGRVWNNASSGIQFDFTKQISGNVTLNLVLSNTEAAVVFLQKNPNFTSPSTSDEYTKNKYWGLDVKIIEKNTTVAEYDSALVPEETGYNFTHWGTSETATSGFNFASPISGSMVLYPVYTLKTYTLTFRHYDDELVYRTVSHGQVLADVPEPKDQPNFISNGWYEESDTSHTPFNFIYGTITSNMVFLPLYSAADFEISFTANSFGTFGTYESNTFTEFTTPQYSANGANYTFYISLNSNYNQHALAKSNISRAGSIASMSLEAVTGKTGIYRCTLITVTTSITIGLTGIPKNKYTIEFNTTYAAGISVQPHSSLVLDTDYFIEDGKFKVEYGKYFYFELVVGDAYESEDPVNYDGGHTAYFDSGTVEYSSMYGSYRVTKTNGNSNIAVTVNTVECVTAVFTGVDNLTLSGFDNPSFSTALVVWDDSTKTARIRKGTAFTFSAASVDPDRFYIVSVTGVTFLSGQYRYYSNVNQDVAFNVVETVFVTVPAATTGSPTITGTSDISGSEVTYNASDASWTYRVTKGGKLRVAFAFTTEYSDTDVNIEVPGTSVTINKEDFEINSIVSIENITTTCIVVINPLQKNTYTIGLISNDMAVLENGDGYASNVVEYAGDFSIRITKRDAYSMAIINKSNVVITAAKYADYEVVEVTPPGGGDAYYVINISTIIGDFQVNIEDLSKNSYEVSMIGNQYATITSSSNTALYAGSFVCIYTLEDAYSKATVQPENVKIVETATRNEITTYTVEVRAAQKTITITGVITPIEVNIQGLTKNTYTVSAEYLGTFEAFKSSETTRKTIEHGSMFSFNLSFEDPSYTQSIDVINVQYSINNGDFADLEPANRDETGSFGILTYTIYNVTGNISFNIPALQINRYTVVFYDTDPLDVIYQYNAVIHGSPIQEPTRPTKEGYQCIGWFLTETGSSQFNNFGSGITSDLTLYARYNAQTFTVTFDDDGADRIITVNYGRQCVPPTITARPGFSAYWNLEGLNLNSVKENLSVSAVYTRNNYTVRFLYSSNPAVAGLYDRVLETQTVAYESRATRPTTDPRAQGYSFNGWDYNYLSSPILEDTDIHALFTINEYTVTFRNVTQGGTLASYRVKYNTPLTACEPVAVEGSRGLYQFPYYSGANLMEGANAIEGQLSDGFVLEGWYADDALSVRYNFDNAIKEDTIIYGNMYMAKVSVKFFVDNEFYIEKLVEYNTTLLDIPAVPRKEGYDKTQPQWTIYKPANGSFEHVTNDIEVRADYTINIYTIQFKLPSGDTLVRQVQHGGTVTNIPYPSTDFGEVIVMDESLIKYVTADTVVYITVIDFLPFLIVAAAACVLTFIVVSLVIAIRNMRRGIKNVKRMEELFSAIKKQDARITQMNEQKLKAEIQEKMKEKEKYKRGSFLDD